MTRPSETPKKPEPSKMDSTTEIDFEARYHRLVDNSNDLIVDIDLDGRITSVNPGTQRLTGYSPEELLGSSLFNHLAPGEGDHLILEIGRIVAGEEFVRAEFELIGKSGSRFIADVSAYPIKHEGRVVGIEGVGRDVTEHHALVESLTFQAVHDSLTGLANRSMFFDHLAIALARAQRKSSRVAVILLDHDGFKDVNDLLGHAAGDTVLIAVAERLTRDMRQSEGVMRLGGDEFVVIIEGADTDEDLAAIAERIVAAISEPIEAGDRKVILTASLGISRSQPGDDPSSLLRRADVAMYQVKAFRTSHRNQPSTSWGLEGG